MKTLEKWFAHQRTRHNAMVLLEDALLSGNFRPYAFYRMRLFGVRVGAELIRHVLEFFLIVSFFSPGQAVVILIVRTGAFLWMAFWWGGLEKMRQEIRTLYRHRKSYRIVNVIRPWLNGALTLSTLMAGGLLLAFIAGWALGLSPGPAAVLILVIGLRTAMAMVLRAYHSGVYAIRRIYRPIYVVLGLELVAAAIAFACRGSLGAWALPVISALTAVISTLISYHYVTQVYRFLRLQPLGLHISFRSLRMFTRCFDRLFVWAGLSYALAQTEWLLVLVLILSHLRDASAMGGTEVFYLLGPIASACRDWAQLFYFDLKKLEVDFFANFKKALERNIESVAVVMATFSWLAACAVWAFFRPLSELRFAPLLAPFFLVHAVLAYQQVRVFSARDYVRLALGSLAFLGVSLAAILLAPPGWWVGVFVLVGMLWNLSLLAEGRSPGATASPQVLSLADWCWSLGRSSGMGRVGTVRLRDESRWWRERVAQKLKDRLGKCGEVTLVGAREIMWFEKKYDSPMEKLSLHQAGLGLATGFQILPWFDLDQENVTQALARVSPSFSASPWQSRLGAMGTGEIISFLQTKFAEIFPTCEAIDLRQPDAFQANRGHLKGLLLAATRNVRGELGLISKQREVSAFSLAGNLTLIFIHERNPLKGRDWKKILLECQVLVNLRAGA